MLEEYKACLSRVTLLSREEEQALWKEYKVEEEIDARQRLIENYQPLVFKEAVKYGLQEAVTMDLIQEGTVGLMEAVERYDPLAGVAFSLYAIHRIRGRMLNFLNANKRRSFLRTGRKRRSSLRRPFPIWLSKVPTVNRCMRQSTWQCSDSLPKSRMSFALSTWRSRPPRRPLMPWASVRLTYTASRNAVSGVYAGCSRS